MLEINAALNTGRIERNITKAQYWLDKQVMTDMAPLMPHVTGTFVNDTAAWSAAIAGTGVVIAGVPPMGRFLYEGKVMIDPVTFSPWAREGARKIVTDRDLQFSNPGAVAHWFDAAKELHGKEWVNGVQKIAGGNG